MKEFFQDLLNRFVGMNSETRQRTILAVLVALTDFLSAFGIVEFSDTQFQAIYKLILVIVTGFVWAYCSHYKNNDYTEASVKGTGVTRQIKAEQEEDYVGERFYTNEDGDLLDGENNDYITEKVDEDTMAAEMMAAEIASMEDDDPEEDD